MSCSPAAKLVSPCCESQSTFCTPTIQRTSRMRGSLGARASAFVTVVLLHVFAIGAFWYGLAESGARPVPDILEVRVIDTDRHPEPLPPLPLPQVDLNRSQAIQIAAPEVAIPAADPAPPLQVEIVESGITPTPPRGPAAAPAPRP